MNRPIIPLLILATVLIALNCRAELQTDGPQSSIDSKIIPAQKYPRIVLYSVSWCPHCKEAKEYLTSHNIPFINKDVEVDTDARSELMEKYKMDRVPLIVLGNDEKILKGFNRENFEKVLKEMGSKTEN